MENESTQQPNLDQDKHDQWLAQRSQDQIKRMAKRLKDLALSKDKSEQPSLNNEPPKH